MTAEVTLRLTPIPQGSGHTRKQINSFDAVVHMQENSPRKRFLLIVRCGSPFMRLAQHLTALGAWYMYTSNVCLVGENPT